MRLALLSTLIVGLFNFINGKIFHLASLLNRKGLYGEEALVFTT